MCGSLPWGAAAFLLCLFILLLKSKSSPPFSRSTNCITMVPKPGRNEGHTVREPSLLRGIAVLRRSGSRKKLRPLVAARDGGAGAVEDGSRRQVGRKSRCSPPCLGRSRERGTGCRLPSIGGAIIVRQEAEEHRATHQRCPVPSHGTASESFSASWGLSGSVFGNRTEFF